MKKICRLIWDYHSGTLDPHKSKEFEEHLKACSSCREKLDFLNRLHESLSDLGDLSKIQVSLEVKDRIMRKLDLKSDLKYRKNLNKWKLAYVFSLATISILSLIFLFLAPPFMSSSSKALTFKAFEENVSPPKMFLPRKENEISQYHGAYYLKVSSDELSSLSSDLSQNYFSQDGTRIYVFSDKTFLSILEPVKPLDEIQVLTSVYSPYPLPQGNYLLILDEQDSLTKGETGLFFNIWTKEMQESFLGWHLLPLFLVFLCLGLYVWLRKRFLLALFCLFFLIFAILPVVLRPQGNAYFYLGNPEKLVSGNALAKESTPQYGRIFIPPEEGQEALKSGFYLSFEPLKLPSILENLDWGQENSLQIFYFTNSVNALFLALAIFLTKAIYYLSPLLLLVAFLLGPGKRKKVILP